MKVSTQSRYAGGLIFLFTTAVVGVVYQQVQTSLTEQDAASGDAFTNAALFPEAVAAALIFLMVIILEQAFLARKAATETSDEELPKNAINMQVGFLVLFGAFLTLIEPVGYHIVTPLFLAGFFRILGNQSFIRCLVYGVTISLIISVFFELLLNVVLPVGFLNLSLPMLLN